MCVKFEEIGQNLRKTSERRASLSPFLLGFEGEDESGSNVLETNVKNFNLRAFEREPNASAVSLGSWATDNVR